MAMPAQLKQTNSSISKAPWRRLSFTFAILLGLSCAVTAVFPQIDLTVSRWFFDPSTGYWPIAQNPVWQTVRQVLWKLADLIFVGALAIFILRMIVPTWRKSGRAAAGFLTLSYLLGPGLIVNVLLKEHWGRARPLNVVEFGGDHLFTSALTIADQCIDNCSFVGGEPSSFAALFFVLVFMLRASLYRQNAYRKLGVALFVAVFGSLLRVAFGHHFLSDIFFAWAAMFAVVAGIAAVFDRLQWDYRLRTRLDNLTVRHERKK